MNLMVPTICTKAQSKSQNSISSSVAIASIRILYVNSLKLTSEMWSLYWRLGGQQSCGHSQCVDTINNNSNGLAAYPSSHKSNTHILAQTACVCAQEEHVHDIRSVDQKRRWAGECTIIIFARGQLDDWLGREFFWPSVVRCRTSLQHVFDVWSRQRWRHISTQTTK